MKLILQIAFILFSTVVCHQTLHAAQRPSLAKFVIPGICPGIKTSAEIEDANGVRLLHVIFVGKRPTASMTDKVSRAYLAKAIKQFSKNDILVFTWFRAKSSGGPDNDDEIYPYPGLDRSGGAVTHRHLRFHANTGSISN